MRKIISTLFIVLIFNNCFSENKVEVKSIVCGNIFGGFTAYPSIYDHGVFIITEEAFTEYLYSFKFFDITTQKLHELCSYSDEEKFDSTDRPLCYCKPILNNNKLFVNCSNSKCLVIKDNSSKIAVDGLPYELKECPELKDIDSSESYDFQKYFDQKYSDNKISIYITDSILVYVDGKKRIDFSKFKTSGFKYFKGSQKIITLSFVHSAYFKENNGSDFDCEIDLINTSETKINQYNKMFEEAKSSSNDKHIKDFAECAKWVISLLMIKPD